MDLIILRRYEDTSSSDDDEEILEYILSRRPKTFRPRISQIDCWDDIDFKDRYRMSKQIVLSIVDKITNDIRHQKNRNNAVSPLEQVLLTLRFYATGNIQQCTADLSGLHKSTVCRIIHSVTQAICLKFKFLIKMPNTPQEIRETVSRFYGIAKFASVIGAIDCTHVPILNPEGDNAELYRNRKDYYSFNVQVVADANLNIMNIVARWPGSAHDSTIFNASNLNMILENGEFGSCCLVGDRGYALKSYLMTPLTNPSSSAEKLFNESQIRTRNVVERTFGVWKRRFPCIGSKLRVCVNNVEPIIVATAILHNICINNKESLPTHTVQFDVNGEVYPAESVELSTSSAQTYRNQLIENYFARLLNFESENGQS